MVADLNSLVRLTKDQIKPAAVTLAKAFQDYPLSAYFFPDGSERERIQPVTFQSLIRYGIRYGEVYATSPNLEGVAVWFPSDRRRRTLWSEIRSRRFLLLFRVRREVISRQKAYGDYAESVRKRCAPFPHLYLQVLGVDPVHQGRGYSSLLLRAMFARIDEEGLPCFLETQVGKNVALYQHLGFRVVEEGIVPGSNVNSWAMLRDIKG
ncbi:MAG: GNAT family N-acetyltransferase [Dehalococcoidales bacterium]|nr:GNAT family N-acetyltransferase [Dehalococcoidales bacterium]